LQILGGGRLAGSLKSHEVRLGLPDVRDLPFRPGTELTAEQIQALTAYCQNDVNATEALYFGIEQEVEVRLAVNAQFPYLAGSAFRRGNASIAEAVIKRELETKAGLDLRDVKKPEHFRFDPGSHIDPAVAFCTEHNQQLLKRLRGMPPFEPRAWLDGLNQGYLFHVGAHKVGLGKGGAHTIIPHLCVRSENIVGYDVASYYPSLLRRLGRYPAGLTRKWLDILGGLTDQRLAAKRAGDKAKASVFKIIVNSIYGKLEDQFSINRDSSLQLAVVLNGQLFLIMLMEAFHAAGFEVISANTDGVYVDAKDRLDEAQQVADAWVSATGFDLERDIATIFVGSSVNDYAL
jgi:hypothetical protein